MQFYNFFVLVIVYASETQRPIWGVDATRRENVCVWFKYLMVFTFQPTLSTLLFATKQTQKNACSFGMAPRNMGRGTTRNSLINPDLLNAEKKTKTLDTSCKAFHRVYNQKVSIYVFKKKYMYKIYRR